MARSAPNRPTMRSPAVRRFLECLLGLYFVAHIPITLFLDLQMVLPRELFAVEVSGAGMGGKAGEAPGAPRRLPKLRPPLCRFCGAPRSLTPTRRLPRAPG